MSRSLDRARILFQQSRVELAEKELRQALSEDPNDAEPHALLALCLVRREQWDDATQEARQAIHLAPDASFTHYTLSCVLAARNRLEEAERAIREAIRIDPFHADYFAHLSSLKLAQSRWKEALDAAEMGLEIEADHVECTNCRARALVKLGRREEAGRTIDAALARDPEDANSHANMGWTLLEQRQPQKAMEHFREALRLDPESEWARQGIVESMKARHFLYRAILGFFFWMSHFSRGTQWLLLLGILFGKSVLQAVVKAVPVLAPLYWPIVIGYLLFAIMTWIASPLFNLVLRFDRFGRLALSREQTIASNLLAACIGGAVLVALGPTLARYFQGQPFDADVLLAALVIFGLSLPVTNIFNCDEGWPRFLQMAIAGGLTLLVAVMTLSVILNGPYQGSLFMMSVNGIALSTWAGVFLSGATVRR